MWGRFERFEQTNEHSEVFDEALHRDFRQLEEPSAAGEQMAEGPETEVPRQGEWVDTGIHEVPVGAIDVADTYVHGESDFQKVSHEDMVHGFERLENEVRPAVERGVDEEYFRTLDMQRRLDYQDGSQRVYEAFYGDDAVRLNKIGDRYEMVNGYHRLYVAKELGIDTVPARVIEQKY